MRGFGLFKPRASRDLALREAAEDLFARLRELEAAPFRGRVQMRGQHAQNRGGPGHDFWQYRDFQTGDHARDADWRQSARTDRVLIRQKEKETQKKSTVWLQNDADMHFGGSKDSFTKYETGAVLALTLTMLGQEHHDIVTLSGVGAVSADDLTYILSGADFQPSVDDLPGQDVTVIGDFTAPIETLEENLFKAIAPHKKVTLLQILDPLELDLPFSGRTIFERVQQREHVLSVETIRQTYKDRLAQHCAVLADLCRERNWTYLQIRNGQDLLDPLLLTLERQAA
jgi:uncharacterized protein (DUF58 family)